MKSVFLAMVFMILSVTMVCSAGYTEEAWERKGGTRAQKQQDYRECEYEAVKYGFVPERKTGLGMETDKAFTDMDRLVRKYEIINKCLESRGYHRANKVPEAEDRTNK